MITFTLALAPVAWERVKRGRYGQAYVPPKTKKFERDVAHLTRKQTGRPPVLGPIKLTIRFIVKSPKRPKFPRPAVRPDLDNYLKAAKDGLSGVLWADDAQVVDIIASKYYGSPPRIEIEIEEVKK